MTTAAPPKTPKTARRKVSYETYLEQAGETRITEWVDGEIITYMPPLLEHQSISRFLFRLLDSFVNLVRLGEVFYAPFEVKLYPGGPSREPDLFFVSNERRPQLKSTRFEGAPDLVVEIVSTSSVREDKVRKFAEYEQAGVTEYWLIDPRPRQKTAEFFQRDESGIYRPAEVGADGIYHARVIPGFWLSVDWLWQDPLPDHQSLLAEIIGDNETLPAEVRQLYAGFRGR